MLVNEEETLNTQYIKEELTYEEDFVLVMIMVLAIGAYAEAEPYVSEEYKNELKYNSMKNVYFGREESEAEEEKPHEHIESPKKWYNKVVDWVDDNIIFWNE